MDQDQIKLTYETLFEILRREKNRGELQELDKSFLQDVALYLLEKTEIMEKDNEQTKLFGEQEKLKTLNELTNIKKIIKEIYEKRERKIIELVVNKSRTNSNLITNNNLLPEELGFYNSLLEVINQSRKDILFSLLELKKTKILKAKIQQSTNTKMVKFIQAVPEFIGKELETYGPYKIEDITNLPPEIAQILLEKNQAEEVNISQ